MIDGSSETNALMFQAAEPDLRKWKIHRNRRGWHAWYQRWLEAWWIITGKWSLHRAWQDGLDYGARMEVSRAMRVLTGSVGGGHHDRLS